jgi:hypothetical protein
MRASSHALFFSTHLSHLTYVQATLGKVDRGWFDMHRMTQDVYDVSRLRMFYVLAKLMMQDSLRTIAANSCSAFAAMIYNASATLIESLRREWPVEEGLFSTVFKAPTNPIFCLDLVVRDGTCQLSTPVGPFVEAILKVFYAGVDATTGIHNIEPLLMPDLFWVGEPMLQSVDPSEPWLVALIDQITECIEAHKEPLTSYRAMYKRYDDLIQLDEAAYLDAFLKADHEVAAIRAECLKVRL